MRHRHIDPIRSDLRIMVIDGGAFSLMVGVGETYLAAFALAIGAGDVTAGLIASVPLLAGAVLQLVSPAAVRRLGSLRRWVVLCAAIQGLAFVPLVLGAFLRQFPIWLIFVVAAVYWGAGMAAGPAWNTWVEWLVPRRLRTSYFAHRARICQACLLIGVLGGGIALESATAGGRRLETFAAIFAIAAGFRLVSVYCLSRQRESPGPPRDQRSISFVQLISRARHGADGKFLLYLVALQAAAQFAAPYFTPYMLHKLDLRYGEYMALVATAFLTRIMVTPWCGRFAARHGAGSLMWVGAMGIVPIAAMWAVNGSLPYLLLLQVFGGAAWAAHELAALLLVFETIPEKERTSILTLFNLTHSAGTVCGAVAGSFVLSYFDASIHGYAVLFVGSSLARACCLLLLWRAAAPVFFPTPLILRTLAVRPSQGSLDDPLLPSIAKEPSGSPAALPTGGQAGYDSTKNVEGPVCRQ